MHFIVYILVGLFFGLLARYLVRGEGIGGWLLSGAVGIAGSAATGLFGELLGAYHPGDIAGYVMSLLGSWVFLWLYHAAGVRPRFGRRARVRVRSVSGFDRKM